MSFFLVKWVKHTSATQNDCPAGSYELEEHICKQEPTGCPYGDSISLDDCEKFGPVEIPVVDEMGTISAETGEGK